MRDEDERHGARSLMGRSHLRGDPDSGSQARVRARGKPRLLEELRGQLRMRHRSLSTERSYVGWVKRFIFFHEVRHPREMGKEEVEAFLNHLAMELGVAASTQNQALNALVFLYRFVIDKEIGQLSELIRAKRPARLPVVMTVDEVERVLGGLSGDSLAVSLLLWGGGLRLMEELRLRVQDVDFDRRELRVRDGKGRRDRLTVLPERVTEMLRDKITASLLLHRKDLARGHGEVELPDALARKYPRA